MTGAKLIEYQPGTHRGDRSRWRINFPVDEPPPKKVPTQGGTLKKVPTQGGHLRVRKVPTPGRKRYPHPAEKGTHTLTRQKRLRPERWPAQTRRKVPLLRGHLPAGPLL